MKIKITLLKSRILSTLKKGFSNKDASYIADYLVWAEMSGIKTQGILKLTGTEPLQNIIPKSKIIIERETKISQRIDAGANPAILVATIATQNAIKKAKKHGIGIIGVRNTFSSNGAQAYYVEQIAKQNLIGFMCSRSPASTTGFDSIDPLFGTNPFGVAFPTNDSPIVFDMATSAMTFYGLILAKAKGEKLPINIAIDSKGNLTTDPEEAMNGAILPFDKGYKGAGIGMMIEILAGPLIASAYVDNKTFKEEWGTLIIAIDPNVLVDVKQFKSHCAELITKIKNSRKKKGVSEIRLPGEHANALYKKAAELGTVDIDEVILKQLKYI